MKRFRTVTVEKLQVDCVICNKCGRNIDYEGYEHQYTMDFTTIEHTYNYGSTKDGDRYLSHICEPCMDEFYATFMVKPEIWVAGAGFEEEDGQKPEPSNV